MQELRGQIKAILHDFSHFRGEESTYIHTNDRDKLINEILSLPVENLWVEKECSNKKPLDEITGATIHSYSCPICQGTGIITRQATWGDVDICKLIRGLSLIKVFIEDRICIKEDGDYLADILTTPDGGRLVCKG